MAHEIPEPWKERVRQHVLDTTGETRDYLNAYNFRSNRHVYLRFPDGSFALFRNAFSLSAPDQGEVAVFTEHCGYHFFPLHRLVVEQVESRWTATDADSGEGSI